MEVVKTNFRSCLPQVEEVIRECEFVAIDTEFTGLALTPADKPSSSDSLDDLYHKLRRTIRHCTVCQFGLSAFVKDPNANKFVAHTFNFYLFPQHQGEHDPRFTVQVSTAIFLRKHGFDFNKWIYEGILFCNQQEEDLMMATVKEKEIDQEKKSDLIGFTHLFRILSSFKKPLLGHNMRMDLAFMLDKFHNPLPESFTAFKEAVHALFPTIVDTKYLYNELKGEMEKSGFPEAKNLEELYSVLQSKEATDSPVVVHSKASEQYGTGKRFHEAGYDAYCCGFAFLRLAHLLAMRELGSTEIDSVDISRYFQLTECFSNRLNLSSSPDGFMALVEEKGLVP